MCNWCVQVTARAIRFRPLFFPGVPGNGLVAYQPGAHGLLRWWWWWWYMENTHLDEVCLWGHPSKRFIFPRWYIEEWLRTLRSLCVRGNYLLKSSTYSFNRTHFLLSYIRKKNPSQQTSPSSSSETHGSHTPEFAIVLRRNVNNYTESVYQAHKTIKL